MIKRFSELENGARFTLNEKEYEKVNSVKVSCCKTINAKLVANDAQRIFVTPTTEVAVAE